LPPSQPRASNCSRREGHTVLACVGRHRGTDGRAVNTMHLVGGEPCPKPCPQPQLVNPYAQRLPLLPLIVKEPGSRSKNFSRSAATRSQVVRHSFRVIWVAASQSVKQVLSQKATRSFISWMSLADLSVEEDGCGVGLTGWATDLAKANSAARQRTKIQATPRMEVMSIG